MANYYLCVCLLRVALPVCLTLSFIFRPCILSAFYLLLLLYLPFVPVPTQRTMSGHTGHYLKITLSISVITTVAQIAFQIVLASMPPYGHFLKSCEFLERVLRHVGFVRFDHMYAKDIIQWLSPEIIMLFASTFTFILSNKFSERLGTPLLSEEGEAVSPKPKKKQFGFVVVVGRYLSLASLAIAAVLRPSVPGAFYFIIFIGCATWWSCCKDLRRGYAIVCRLVMVVLFVHICTLFTYQFQWPQEFLSVNSTWARYFGLTPIMNYDCSDPRVFYFNDIEWASYINPLWLLWLYYILAIESRVLLRPQVVKKSMNNPSEKTPLIRGVSPSRKYGAGHTKSSSILQDSTGSVTITGEGQDDIPMQQMGLPEEELQPSFLENLIFGLASVFQVLVRSSYIATNITMMAWSITYHSWLTFVLLLWANLLWLLPNQRRAMLRSAPFLVIYAEFLLLSAYVYCMNLTEEELPSTIQGINLGQIGFEKITILPCKPLLVKCLYTTMFWITLRQFMHERQEAKQTSTLADIVAPLQVTVGAATTSISPKKEQVSKGDKIMKKIGEVLKKFLTKTWIWIVAINLFVVAITGERMTGFRIIYMFLFLFFILTFQLSYNLWRKIMLPFWLTVIGYSMLTLVLVYTYQFDHFPDYWAEYLKIPKNQQADIGLEKFETKQLFVRLLTPTFFVVITVIQVHYFHKDFLEISEPSVQNITSTTGDAHEPGQRRSDASSAQGYPWDTSEKTDTTLASHRTKFSLKNIRNKQMWIALGKHWAKKIEVFYEYMWLYLELHMFKLVALIGLLMCVYDICAIHMAILLFFVIALTFGQKVQGTMVHLSSILVSAMLIAKMIYQIEYIDHQKWDVNCNNVTMNNSAYNNAVWFGFQKVKENMTLPSLVKWYIGFILVVMIRAITAIRQHHIRISQGKSRVYFMFPRITRKDADKNISYCIKYLFNYGFYKFGVEICLMSMVALIGTRMDLYAVFHAIWLCFMFSMTRKQLHRIWNVYLGFIAFLLPIQYLMVIGLPPGLCLVYPWDNSELLRRVQDWMFLLDSEIEFRPSAKKLLCDIFLLILVSRQAIVFRVENRWAREQPHREYPGGSNESIIHRAEEPGFVNPVPDFVTYVRSWLDIFKRGILQSLMWITLAIVFLAGTNRVNLFSIGYLIGSFIFLWQGSDLYLKPIPSILKSWNCLIGYNVFVIFIKAVLQIVGCIFIKDVEEYACWFVQLLGIGCIQKFDISSKGLSEAECTVPREDVGLAWDGVCFAFLLLQRRLFKSYNFFHIIDESKAATILASRGAELIEELRERQMSLKADEESKILEKIKQKMDRIKANQQKIQGPSFKDPTSHYVAIRSGDYYMFDDLEDEEELAFITEKEDELDDDGLLDSEREEGTQKRQATTVKQLLDDVMKTDVSTALNRSESATHAKRPKVYRRASMPLARQRSSVSTRSRLSAPLPILFKGDSPRRAERQTVTIFEEGKRDEDRDKRQPKPGSSKQKDDEISLLSDDDAAVTKQESQWRKFVNWLLFIWKFLESLMNTATNYLNKFSRDYRYVLRVLTKEKKLLKEKTEFTLGVRKGSTQIWEPIGSFQSLVKKSRINSGIDLRGSTPDKILSDSQADMLQIQSGEKTPQTLQDSKKEKADSPETGDDYDSDPQMDIMEDYEGAEMSSVDQPPFIRLLHAIWFVILSHSDIVCYFMIFLNQIKSPTILSLPLPLMVFLWGTLTIPRPSKTFWVTIIAYTEVIVLVKCIFQFELLPWNQNNPITSNNPFYAPKILGIERKPQYAIYDLLVLLVVFFHRFMLKTLGLWKSTVEQSYSSSNEQMFKQQDGPSEVKLTPKDSKDTSKADDSEMDQSELSKIGLVQVKTTEIEPMSNVKESLKLASSKYSENYRKFFKQLLDPTSRITVDVYAYMFMCDFFNFMVLIFGFAAFGSQQGDGGVSAYLQENKVPIPFLLMLILQFVLIIVDRALFLRKYILGKIIFQFLQIIGVHIWMFFVLPAVTERSFNANLPPQMWYMVKSFYLLLSAYQIRCGYPTRILGNFLCKGYNYVNMFLFKIFMAIPFLFELRTIMDWMWTDTSMTIFDWLKMEDIFAHIFQLKCSRHVETEYPQPRGEKKSPMVKYFMGGAGLFGIIAVIWFPLVFFALGSTVGQANTPYDVTVNVRIGPYQNIFSMSAQSNAMFKFSQTDFITMRDSVYKKNRVAQTFLSFYEYDDIAAVRLNGNSTMVWAISPPDLQRMIEEVNSTKPVIVKLQYIISRTTNNKQEPGVVTSEQEVVLEAEINGIPNPERQKLLNMLTGNVNASAVYVRNLFPKFVKVTNRGTATPVTQLMSEGVNDIQNSLRNITMKLSRSEATTEMSSQMWWELREHCNDTNYEKILRYLPQANCEYLMMYTFNEKSFPASLSFLSGGGIIGLYTTLVFVVSRMIRGFFSEICFKIMFDDMPNVDRILQLCLDIYLVREARELCLEEDLFAKLVFLFRSPETLIKWTRPKEEDENEGIDPDEEPQQGGQ